MSFRDAVLDASAGFTDSKTESFPDDLDRPGLRKLRSFLSGKPSSEPIFKFRIRHMERRTRAYLTTKGIDVAKDWSLPNIDWKVVLKFLITILPLILLLFP